jgi:hypothetical protein
MIKEECALSHFRVRVEARGEEIAAAAALALRLTIHDDLRAVAPFCATTSR